MPYLLTQIAGLLLAATLLGAALTWWRLRRRHEDVTTEYQSLNGDWRHWRLGVDQRLSQPVAPTGSELGDRLWSLETAVRRIANGPAEKPDLQPVLAAIEGLRPAAPVDLSGVLDRLAALDLGLRSLSIPAPTPATDLGPVMKQLAQLERQMAAIRIPAPVAPDFSSLNQRLSALHERVSAIVIPDPTPAPAPVNLAPLALRLDRIEERVAAIRIPKPEAPDFSDLQLRLSTIETRIGTIRMPEIPAARPVDLSPVQARLTAIEDAIAAIRIPAPPPAADLGPLIARLDALEARIAELRSVPPAPLAADPRPNVRAGSRNLLRQASYGAPDDLKVIVGIGPVLERMLHDIGVYYHWQIGEWQPEDVAYVDGLLTAFKGRIQRDDWVPQAARLALEPTSARKPPEDQV